MQNFANLREHNWQYFVKPNSYDNVILRIAEFFWNLHEIVNIVERNIKPTANMQVCWECLRFFLFIPTQEPHVKNQMHKGLIMGMVVMFVSCTLDIAKNNSYTHEEYNKHILYYSIAFSVMLSVLIYLYCCTTYSLCQYNLTMINPLAIT